MKLPVAFAARPLLFAHRGLSAAAPENSLEAFRLAAAAGCTAVELDVRCCRDALVVFHDDSLARMFGRDEAVSALDLAALRALDLGGGARIPTLAEVYEALPPTVAVNVELKDPAAVAAVADTAAAFPERTLVSAFDHASLHALRRRSPETALAPLFGRITDRYDTDEVIGIALALDAAALHLSARDAPAEVIAAAHAADLPVFCYTVNDIASFAKLRARGVDGVFSDDPRALA